MDGLRTFCDNGVNGLGGEGATLLLHALGVINNNRGKANVLVQTTIHNNYQTTLGVNVLIYNKGEYTDFQSSVRIKEKINLYFVTTIHFISYI